MIEFKVRPVSRFVVTRYEQNGKGASCGTVGEFDNHRSALDVAHAMAQYEGGEFAFSNNLEDPPAMLRHIAEEVGMMIPVKRGLVFIELENGSMLAYGLGKQVGDIDELAAKGIKEINTVATITTE